MKGSIVAALAVLPVSAFASGVVIGPPLSGTNTIVNNSTGDNSDPHVSGNVCAYTHDVNAAFSVHYFDFTTASDAVVPGGSGTIDLLSDVSNGTVAFTRVFPSGQQSIFTYAPGAAAATEVDPTPGCLRDESNIGGNTIAWQDLGFGPLLSNAEIVAWDVPSGTATRLTNDAVTDQTPAVSPDGAVITWCKCPTQSTCDVWSATGGGSHWTVRALTSGTSSSHPDSNGQIVVYSSNRAGKDSIFWQPAGGGAEQQLDLAGSQISPSIAGQFVAFASKAPGASNYDIFVVDLSTMTAYQITNSTDDKRLDDITQTSDGLVRVVWQVTRPDNTHDVEAFSFRLDPVCKGGGDGDDDDDNHDGDDHHHHGNGDGEGDHHHQGDCNNPGNRPLLASVTVHAGPVDDVSASFSASDTDDGLLCVDNGFGGAPATFGDVRLNDRDVVEEDTLEDNPVLIQEWVRLDERNSVHADCDKPAGAGYRVLIYGPTPDCSKGHSRQERMASLAVAPTSSQPMQLQLIQGKPVSLVAATPSSQISSQTFQMDGAGCDSVPGGTLVLSALLAVAGWLGLSRATAPSRARRRRR